MIESLKQLKEQATFELNKIVELSQLDDFMVKYFGRKQGKLTHILRSIKNLDDRQRKILGSEANELKIEIWRLIDVRRMEIKKQGKKEFIDLTLDGDKPKFGHMHPITQVRREIEEIFKSMGFAVVEGPEIESDYFNFEALNIPQEHPARDMWDTFYLKGQETKPVGEKLILRTHTSPMQVRIMREHTPPMSVIVPGRVFRNEATDARHEHTIDMMEGFLVDKKVTLGHLKWVLENLFKSLFGKDVEIKLRPSYFPFTEPSIELLMSCIFCNKKGCSVCRTGWLEMLGAGMIHPKVFEAAGYPKDKYSGFAFGIGLSRVAMLKYNIPDIRLLYQNDIRFLNQF